MLKIRNNALPAVDSGEKGNGLLEGRSKSPLLVLRARVFRSLVRSHEVTARRECQRLRVGFLLGCGSGRLRLSGRSGFSGLPGFSSGSAEQSQSIFRIEGEAANGLFSRGAEGDIHTAIVGKADGQQVFQNLLLFRRAQIGI